jgi:hypothetical protein
MGEINLCHHCGNVTPHTLLLSQEFDDPHYGEDDNEYAITSALYVLRCETCRGLSLYYELEPGDEPNWYDATLQWPKSAFLGPGVPKAVQLCYEEAALVKHRAPNGYAVLIRSMSRFASSGESVRIS